jgi:predicted ATPase
MAYEIEDALKSCREHARCALSAEHCSNVLRSLDDCCAALGERTLFAGDNNSGKSSFLHALAIAFASTWRWP